MKVVFLIAACASVLAVFLICVFLFANGLPAMGKIGPLKFLFGTEWRPTNDKFGILPMIVASIYVTAGAILIGVPIALFTSVFMARYCPKKIYKPLKSGIELMAGARITNWLRWDINATWSRNRIKNYTEYLSDVNEDWKDMYSENWGISQTTRYIGTTPISFSPDFMANSLISLDYKGFNASLQTQYVSKQYLNNAHQEDCTLDAYCVSNLNLGYTFKLKGLKSVNVGVTIYNLFDETYESNGYASGSAVYEGHGKNQIKDKDSKLLYTSNYAAYYPNAGINALAHITLSF